MNKVFQKSLSESIQLKTLLLNESYIKKLIKIGDIIIESIIKGNKLMICGNGGSAADAQHLAAELIVRLRSNINRSPISAISLALDTSSITACGNDFGFFIYEFHISKILNNLLILILLHLWAMP